MIEPGATLYDAAATLKAQVRADGTLALAGEQGSIHKMGARVQGRPACNGWTFWHFKAEHGLQPIDVLREQARRQLGLALLASHGRRIGPARPTFLRFRPKRARHRLPSPQRAGHGAC